MFIGCLDFLLAFPFYIFFSFFNFFFFSYLFEEFLKIFCVCHFYLLQITLTTCGLCSHTACRVSCVEVCFFKNIIDLSICLSCLVPVISFLINIFLMWYYQEPLKPHFTFYDFYINLLNVGLEYMWNVFLWVAWDKNVILSLSIWQTSLPSTADLGIPFIPVALGFYRCDDQVCMYWDMFLVLFPSCFCRSLCQYHTALSCRVFSDLDIS